MSGPKSISYSVEHLAAVRAAALTQLRAESRLLRLRAAALAKDVAAAKEEGAAGLLSELDREIADDDDPARLEVSVRRVRTNLQHAEGQLAQALLQHRTQVGLDALATGGGGRGRSAAEALAAAVAEPGPQPLPRTGVSRIPALLARMPDDAPPAVRKQVAALASRALQSGAPQLVDQLGLLVDRARPAVLAARRARSLLDAALGLPDVDEASRALSQVEDGVLSPTGQDWERWQATITASRAAHERAYVLNTTADILTELGYELGPDFATTLAAGASCDAQQAKWDGFAVRMRATYDMSLNVNVVRDIDDASDDATVENAWCHDVQSLRRELRAAGVSTDLHRAVPAGARPVQRVVEIPRASPAEPAASPPRRRKGSAAQERPL